jgi:hypothetical protein
MGLITDGQYEIVERITAGRRLSATQIRDAVGPLQLIHPPDEAYVDADLIALSDGSGYSARMPLWTQAGPAELTLEASLILTPASVYRTELDGIHVL